MAEMEETVLLPLIFLLLLIMQPVHADIMTDSVCHVPGIHTINCGAGHTIHFLRIDYGIRQSGADPVRCYYQPGDCRQIQTSEFPGNQFDSFKRVCENRTSCTIDQNNRVKFQEFPCMRDSDYMQIQYSCFGESTTVTEASTTNELDVESSPHFTGMTSTLQDILSTDSAGTSLTPLTNKDELSSTARQTSISNNPNGTSAYTDTTPTDSKSGEILPTQLGQINNTEDMMTAIVAGSVAGGVVLVAIIILGIILLLRRRQTKTSANNKTGTSNSKTSNPAYSPDCDGAHSDTAGYDCISNDHVRTPKMSAASDTYAEINEGGLDNEAYEADDNEQNTFYAQTNIMDKSETEDNEKFTEETAEISDIYAQPELTTMTIKDISNSQRKYHTVAESEQLNMTDDEKSVKDIGDSGVIYAQPDKSKKKNNISKSNGNNAAHKMEGNIYSEVNKPAIKQKPAPLTKKIINKSKTVIPSDTESEIPHQDVEGDLYAQPVKPKKR